VELGYNAVILVPGDSVPSNPNNNFAPELNEDTSIAKGEVKT
jgi:hypothetical protein